MHHGLLSLLFTIFSAQTVLQGCSNNCVFLLLKQPRKVEMQRLIAPVSSHAGIKARLLPWTTAANQRRTRRADAQVRIQKERRKTPVTGRDAAANCLLGSLRDFEHTT